MKQGKNKSQRLADRVPAALVAEPLEARQLLSSCPGVAVPDATIFPAATGASVQGYSPAQIRTAYGMSGVNGTGAGQTIAIIDAYNDPDIASDLATFDTQFGLAAPPSFKVVSQTGGSVSGISTDAGWAGEISLDVEWAHAMAPGANLLLVEADSATLSNLLAAVNYARDTSGVSVVSMSWGGGEFYGQNSYDSYFTTPKGHTGVTFIAASGDEGTNYGVEWPASSPNVVSVGGSDLYTSSSTGTYSNEIPWSGSTGGYSYLESEPSYQSHVQNTGVRTVPDVSFDADPYTGFAVYDSIAYYGMKGWEEVGGTSAGAPQWGALVAIADQSRTTAKLGTLDGATQTLPALYAPAASTTTYNADYHDVTETGYSYRARSIITVDAGYDLQTGLGTPKAVAIEQTLAAAASGSSSTSVSSAVTAKPQLARPNDAPENFNPVTPPAQLPVAPSNPPAAASPSAPFVFNDSLIHHGGDVPAISTASQPLVDLPAPQPIAAIGGINSAQWIGEMDAALVSWLESSGAANVVASMDDLAVAALQNGPVSQAANHGPPAIAQKSVATVQALAPVLAAPAGLIYRFANFDPVATFSDALSDFARESSTLSPLAAVGPEHNSHRAWIVTGAVLGIDTLLAVRWYVDRAKQKKVKEKEAGFQTSDAPQTGLLPTGL